MAPLKLTMSPNIRIRMTLDKEIDCDRDQKIFTPELFKEYLQRHSEAITRQNNLMKSTLLTDAALALLISGKNIKIPGLEMDLSDLPVAQEVLIIMSSMAFMLFCISFINAQLYEAIVQTLARRRLSTPLVDPEFVSAAYTFTELHLKATREKMNIWGVDFFTPSRAFTRYYGVISLLLTVAFIGILALHVGTVMVALWPLLQLSPAPVALACAAICFNVAGLALLIEPKFTASHVEASKSNSSAELSNDQQ